MGALVVFAGDMAVPLGVAVGALYVVPIVLMTRATIRDIVTMAAVCTVLTTIALVVHDGVDTTWMVYANRGISLMCIWSAAALLVAYRRNELNRQSVADAYQAEQKRRLELLMAKNTELEEFAYIASHDLQEPLRSISSFVELLDEEYGPQLDDEARTYVDFIKSSAARMRALIHALLDYNRIGRGRTIERLDPRRLVEAAWDDLAAARPDGAELTIDALPDRIDGCAVELRQLFQNLIANGLKFVAPGTNPKVEVSGEQSGAGWSFRVQDNGIGIAERDRDKVFTIFKRLNHREQYEGSGIGLANCRKIVGLHGGTIWAEGAPGSGTSIRFTLARGEHGQKTSHPSDR